MKGKVLSRERKPLAEIFGRELTQKLVIQAVYFVAGILVARSAVFGSYAPFGVALVAAVPFPSLWTVLAGSIIGYVIPSPAKMVIRYIAAMLAAAAIRWTLNDLARVRLHPVFAPLVAFGPVLATGLAACSVEGFYSNVLVMYIAEAMLAAGAAYFFARTAAIAAGSRGITSLSQQELACVVLTAGIILLSLSSVTIGPISIGRVLAVVAVLFAARFGGVGGGTVAGVACGIVFSLSSSGVNYISGAYAFGGLMAGVFSPLGRIGVAVAFILSNAVVSLQAGSQTQVITGLYEVMASTLIYMVLPAQAGKRFSGVFAQHTDQPHADGLRRSMIMRLDFAAKALTDVSDSVEVVSQKLSKICAQDIGGVYTRAADDVCRRCGLKLFCWEREYNTTMETFNNITDVLHQKTEITHDDFDAQFLRRCSRTAEMVKAVNLHYGEFTAREASERRMAEIRSVVSDQFSGLSEMLDDMAKELEQYETFDFSAAERVTAVLRTSGVIPMDVCCRVDRLGRMSVEIEAAETERGRLNKPYVLKEIAKACDRQFDPPCVTMAPGRCRMQVSERASFMAESAAAQHCCDDGQLCGDCYEIFDDGLGRLILIVSDGMGSGGRAAVDGAMATGIMSRLVKAGLGFDCALRIVNAAMLVKSGDESLATLDVSALDLYSGKLEVMKAGAPVTIVRKKGRAVRMDAPSLPAGILTEVAFAKEEISLSDDDLVVMISDGAAASGDDWLCEEIEQWRGQNVQELADSIVREARERRQDGHDDDITAVVVKLNGGKRAAA